MTRVPSLVLLTLGMIPIAIVQNQIHVCVVPSPGYNDDTSFVTDCVTLFLVNWCISFVLFLSLKTTIMHSFSLMVSEMIELICTRQTVLLLISFGLINLFDYRRKISTFLRRSLSERDWSLFALSNTPFYFPLVFTFLFWFFYLSLICEISPKLLFCIPHADW